MLACAWLLMIFLSNPSGDFPLNDDWAYARPVYSLVNEGRLHFNSWASMSLVLQVFYGALFCLPLGFSFTALRASVLLLGLAGVLATYTILKDHKIGQRPAFLAALLVMVNPLYFSLSNTFMTDVPFFAFAMLAILFLLRWLNSEESGKYIIFGASCAAASTFIRQAGLIIPFAFAAAYLIKKGAINRKNLFIAFAPLIMLAGLVFIYKVFRYAGLGLPALYSTKIKISVIELLKSPLLDTFYQIFLDGMKILIYLGVFLFPAVVLRVIYQWKVYSRKDKYVFAGCSFVFLLLMAKTFLLSCDYLPFFGNILCVYGIGPVTLRDVCVLGLAHLPEIPLTWRLMLTLFGIIGAAGLFSVILLSAGDFFAGLRKPGYLSRKSPVLFMSLIGIAYFILSTRVYFFDRYIIFLLPIVMFLLLGIRGMADLPRTAFWGVCLGILLVYGVFTIALTHDYMSWNRARWKAIGYLTKNRGVPPEDIDGGFEFNGWYNYNPRYKEKPDKSWWWVDSDKYLISFGPLGGYKLDSVYSYSRLLPPERGRIFILHKENSGE